MSLTMPDSLRTEIISDLESFEARAPAWQELFDALDARHPQLEHAWLAAWWRHFAGGERVRVVLLWRGNRLVAALPLRHTADRVAGLPVRELRLLENNETTRGPILMARDDADAANALVTATLAEPGWDRLYWRNLADPEGVPALLATAARQAGLLVTVASDLMVPRRSLARTWDEFLGSVPVKQRHEVERADRKARKQGGGYRVIIHQWAGPELEDALQVVRRLAEASWQHTEAATSIASQPGLWGFYRDISQHLASEGRLLLAVLELGGEPAGFDLCLRAGDTVHILKTGFDPRFRTFSPGRLQVAGVIQHGIRTGARTLDFMGSVDEFKRRWECDLVPQVVLIATRRRLLPMGAHLLRHVAAPALARTALLRPLVRSLRRKER